MTSLLPMAERYQRPDWVRRVNAMGEAAGSPAAVVPIDADELLDAARTTTGVPDFGDLGDGDWERRLRALIDAINRADLTVMGRLMTREEIVRCLRTRLRLADERRRDPTVADEVIRAPIVVTGPARSGTTITFELLALDEGLRSPIAADVLHPGSSVNESERLRMSEAEQELWADVQPEFASMHELRSDLPVECITICAPSFAGSHWSMVFDDPGEWGPDVAADLAFHKAVLQSVQHGKPPQQWLLKTPAYLFILDDLLRVYPDAQVVFTHRDPAKTMPSTASTTAMIRWLRSDVVDIATMSELVGLLFGAALNDIASRQNASSLPAATGHVRFADLMREPADAIASAYEGIGREFTAQHRDSLLRYLKEKPRAKHGAHEYTAEEWGFDVDALRKELASYISTFDVALED